MSVSTLRDASNMKSLTDRQDHTGACFLARCGSRRCIRSAAARLCKDKGIRNVTLNSGTLYKSRLKHNYRLDTIYVSGRIDVPRAEAL